MLILLFVLATWLPAASLDQERRIGQLVTLEGARDNQLVGYGLVVGLNGTGDKRQTIFSTQSLAAMLERMGVQVNPNALLVRNIAAVIVTANLPPYAGKGTKIDVNVAAIGDAQNLQGGVLVQTPLRAANGEIYAAAQGPVVTGGFVAGGRGNQFTTNHPTVGRVIAGALIEQDAPSQLPQGTLKLHLNQADFRVAARISEKVNREFGAEQSVAKAVHGGLVEVTVPEKFNDRRAEFFAALEDLAIPVQVRPKVVINERTGTVLMGRDVALRQVSILHGALAVEIASEVIVSQPAPFSQGETVVTQQPNVKAKEEAVKSITLKEGASVDDLVKALREMGSSARDVIAILQALRAAKALDAELEIL
ncbi:MAG: flagellar basal body P-ring protein FlgI [Bryobacter sp.]|nr:flagellar basal body P-ring protein FlgI [Bryobacter sp.]